MTLMMDRQAPDDAMAVGNGEARHGDKKGFTKEVFGVYWICFKQRHEASYYL